MSMEQDTRTATMPPAVRAHPDAVAAIRAALRGSEAAEPCGYLLGTQGTTGVHVRCAIRGANVHPRPRHAWRLAPEEQMAVRRRARDTQLQLVGFWHGHLDGPPVPSHADVRGVGTPAPACMWIAGREEADGPVVVRAWWARGGQASEVLLTSSARPRPRPLLRRSRADAASRT